MHFEVAVHLKRFEEAVEWSVRLFVAVWRKSFYGQNVEGEVEVEGKKEMTSVMDHVLVVIGDKEKNLFAFALPLIARFLIEITTEEKEKLKEGGVGGSAARGVVALCKDFQSRVCVGYGDYCLKKLQVKMIRPSYSLFNTPLKSR
jgi:hypothetical protein